jgi:hypothetical protein
MIVIIHTNLVFQLTLVPTISNKIGISIDIFKMLFLIIQLFIIVLYIIHLRSNLMNNILTKLLNVTIFAHFLCAVPWFHLVITSCQQITTKTPIP